MGWFDEQLRARREQDDRRFRDAVEGLAGAVMGRGAAARGMDREAKARSAVGEILRWFKAEPAELPEGIGDLNDQIEYLLRPTGVMRRGVLLERGWYRNASGPMLGSTAEGEPVALLPRGLSGYAYVDWKTGKRVRLSRRTEGNLAPEAVCFYRPLPLKALGIADLLKFIAGTLSASDVLLAAFCVLAATLLGMMLPYLSSLIFGSVLPSGRLRLLLPVTVMLLGVTVSQALIGIARNLALARVQTKLDVTVEAASMMRVLMLPAAFFRGYAAGELSSRVRMLGSLCKMLVNCVLTTGLSSVFSLAYLGQIFHYAPSLALPAIATLALSMGVATAGTLLQTRVNRKKMEASAAASGLVYALFSGVQKLRLAGAERRAFVKWAGAYQKSAALEYNPPFFLKIEPVLSAAVSLLGGVLIFYSAARGGVGVSDYMAFNASFGMVSGAFAALSGIALSLARIRPVMEMAEPVLRAVPEVSGGKKTLTRLSGNIELSHVSFRYAEEMPLVLDDFSLKIPAGQYVAIVGKTGCGKSTLLRLLLGFEKPLKGAVYFDGNDSSQIDLRSLRRHIGCVLQDGKLFGGDIYSNIVVSAPWLSREDAWKAAEIACMDEEIRAMPMGMNTLISEGSGGISGGQRQRLMIARAVAPRPRILLFDEATSALDNLTQKKVCQALDALRCTRVVVAHRLSTIRSCDRIVVLDGGRVAEDGSYEQLMEQNGVFAGLVKRQQVEQ